MSNSEDIEKNAPPIENTPVSPLAESDTAFIREKIKERPINKRKLFRRTLMTALLAIVFGGVACLSFLLLEPLFSARISPAEEPAAVTFPTSDDEIQPEDLYANDEEIASAQEQIVAESIQASIEASEQDRVDAAISSALSRFRLDSRNADDLYRSLKSTASEAERSLVLVHAAIREQDFVGGTIEKSGETPGLIVADNGVEILVLTYSSVLKTSASLSVTWFNNTSTEATLKMSDADTGLCVLAVPKRMIQTDTRDKIRPAELGSSLSSAFQGIPVIAIGSPIGIYHSFCYGTVVSDKIPIDLADKALTVFATDIYGGDNAHGFLLNYTGQVVGIIYPDGIDGVDKNRVLAYSISEIKRLIEHLANNIPLSRLGIFGTDVNTEISGELGIPSGAFVLRTQMSSPAMRAGLQSGDVLISFNDTPVNEWKDYVSALDQTDPGEAVTLSILRQSPDDHLAMQLTMITEEVSK
ncbi:MAG: S1C family serine protease [Lachnospiraceae bacterium]|nr:S1C family serine protease [Lachnospiraceae bacterium]